MSLERHCRCKSLSNMQFVMPQMAGDNLMRVVPAFGAALAGGAADGPRGTTRASAYMDILGWVMVRYQSKAECFPKQNASACIDRTSNLVPGRQGITAED